MKGREPCWGVEAASRAPGSLLTGGQLRQEFLLLPPVTQHLLKRDGTIASSTPGPPPPFCSGAAWGRTGFSPALTPWITFNDAADKVLDYVQLRRQDVSCGCFTLFAADVALRISGEMK